MTHRSSKSPAMLGWTINRGYDQATGSFLEFYRFFRGAPFSVKGQQILGLAGRDGGMLIVPACSVTGLQERGLNGALLVLR